jgi:RNA polymerase sigma factor (sigma-70 family)
MTDLELLRRYASSKSEDAFTELVRKYTGLVYAAALRQIADARDAEEITQAVFVILAQKAAAIPNATVLSAWLLRTTRYVAMNAWRKRARRPQAELIDPNAHVTETDAAWKSIAPLLDEGLLGLSESNRNVISLRFFEGRSFREIAEVTGISEDAAQKRVSRALEELRRSFAKRGLALSATLVVGALGTHAIEAAPAHVISAIAMTAGPGAANAGNVATLARQALEAMNGAHRRLIMFRVGVGAGVVLLLLLGLRWWVSGESQPSVPVVATQPANQYVGGQPPAPASPIAAAALVRPGTGELLLRVVDSGTDAPIPKARVIANRDVGTLDGTTITNTTDENGQCSLPADRAPREEWGFYIEILADGYAAQFANWSWERGDAIEDLPTDYKVRLMRGATVGGVVVTERGDPISGAAVMLSLPRGDTTHPTPREREGLVTGSLNHEEMTDADGRWHCAHLPPQFDGLGCLVVHSNFISSSFGMTKLATTSDLDNPEDDFRARAARFVLQDGFVAAGSVADGDGKPIAGAKVIENRDWNNPRAVYRTDQDGRFRVANLPAGESVITVEAEPYLPSDATIHPETEDKDLQFTLAPSARLVGRVVDEAGVSLHALVIAVSGDYLSDRFDWRALTDGEGRFEWLSAPSIEVLYQVQSQGYDLLLRTNLVADGSEQLIRMHRSSRSLPIRISGTVTDEQTGQSINDFQVWMGVEIGIPGPPRINWSRMFGPVLETTGNSGQFTFPMDRMIPSGPLGSLTLQIKAPGYVMTELRVPGPVTNDCRLKFKLGRSELNSGLVVTPDGKSAPGADVVGCPQYATQGLPMPAIVQMNVPGELDLRHTSQNIIHTKSDSEGRFTLVSAPAAKQIIVAHRAGYAAVSMDEFSVSNVITLHPWCRVNGVLKIGNRPATNETILLSNGTLSPRSSGLWPNLRAVSDSDGRFVLENVPPGQWEIGHLLSGGTPGPIRLTQLRMIELPPGKTAQVALGGEGWKVVGTVKPQGGNKQDAREQLFPMLTLKSSAAEPVRRLYAPAFEANGAFTIDDVPPGTYELEAVEMGDVPGQPVSLAHAHMMNVPLANCRLNVTLPGLPSASESRPFDVGVLELQPMAKQ